MIPGVVVHAREAWQDQRYPVFGPDADQAAIDTAVIHYTASPTIPDDLFAFHRAMQRSYVLNRGYSLGYRWSVASGGIHDGEVFQVRGWEYRSAANKGHNEHTEPILVLVDGDDAASPAAVRAVRAIIAESQRRSGRTFRIVGHGEIGQTSCPGVGLRAQIAAGVFTPRPEPEQPQEDMQTMIVLDHNPGTPSWTAMTYTGTHLAWVVNGYADAVVRRAGVARQQVTDAELDGIIRSAMTTTAPPSSWIGTPRYEAWQQQRGG